MTRSVGPPRYLVHSVSLAGRLHGLTASEHATSHCSSNWYQRKIPYELNRDLGRDEHAPQVRRRFANNNHVPSKCIILPGNVYRHESPSRDLNARPIPSLALILRVYDTSCSLYEYAHQNECRPQQYSQGTAVVRTIFLYHGCFVQSV